ncbi:hypothetical protein Tco_1275174 [Tanacetum coccineum]
MVVDIGRTVYSFVKSNSTTVTCSRCLSTKATGGRDEWNDSWETAWLPEDLSAKNQAPRRQFLHLRLTTKGGRAKEKKKKLKQDGKSLYSLENVKRDYRVMKQRVHAGLWVKEIEKMEETKLGGSAGAADDLDTASE